MARTVSHRKRKATDVHRSPVMLGTARCVLCIPHLLATLVAVESVAEAAAVAAAEAAAAAAVSVGPAPRSTARLINNAKARDSWSRSW